MTVRVGCYNWTDHPDFYPARLRPEDRLAYYARYFPVVEVDSTAYHIPRVDAVARWAATTPDTFAFNVKAPRALTLHERDEAGRVLLPTPEIAADFRAALAPLREAGKLRAVLAQFPPSFTATAPHHDHLRRLREWFADDLLAVEFRHRSWFTGNEGEHTLALLRKLGVVYTAVDEPQGAANSVPPVVAVTQPALCAVRFHGQNAETWNDPRLKGTRDRYTYRYTTDALRGWLPKIALARAAATETHLLFNNNAGGHAAPNALEMMDLLGLPHPPLETATQPRLF